MHFFDKKVCPDFIYITAFFASEKVQKTRKKRVFYPKKTSKNVHFWPFLDQNDKIEKHEISTIRRVHEKYVKNTSFHYFQNYQKLKKHYANRDHFFQKRAQIQK